MGLNPFSAKASLAIGVNAQGSQQLVVLLMVAALACIGVATYFLWFSHPMSWLPVIGGGLLVWAAVRCHAKSQPMLDRATAGVTKVTSNSNGLKVETNALTLADSDAAATLERLVSNMAYRQPLPAPDGTVVHGFAVDTSAPAVEDARRHVDEVNQEAENIRQQTIQTICGAPAGVPVLQPSFTRPLKPPPKGVNAAE